MTKYVLFAVAVLLGTLSFVYAGDDDGRWTTSGSADEVQFMCRGVDSIGTAFTKTNGIKTNCKTGATVVTGALSGAGLLAVIDTTMLYGFGSVGAAEGKALCYTNNKKIGYCSTVDTLTGTCTCN